MVSHIPLPILLKLEGNNIEHIEFLEVQWIYSKLHEESKEIQTAILFSALGKEAFILFKQMINLSKARNEDTGTIINTLKDYYIALKRTSFMTGHIWNGKPWKKWNYRRIR